MYTRSPTPLGNRNVRIPRNYSGNAFAVSQDLPKEDPPPAKEACPVSKEKEDVPVSTPDQVPNPQNAAPASKLLPLFGGRGGKLFGSFGTEELLILGLILLLMGNEGNDDLLLLLVLLLLIQ